MKLKDLSTEFEYFTPKWLIFGKEQLFYKHFPFLVDYIAKKRHFRPKISKIRQYIEVILSETNDD